MDAGTVDLDIEDRNRGAHGNRQLQLYAAIDFRLFDAPDLRSDLLGVALHRLGAELDAGQQLDLLSRQVESLPATAVMRRTPGENSRFSTLSAASTGLGA